MIRLCNQGRAVGPANAAAIREKQRKCSKIRERSFSDGTGARRIILSVFTITCLIVHLYLLQQAGCAAEKTTDDKTAQDAATSRFKLNCEPGEQRHFNYESSTQVWGSASQQVRMRASLRLSCMKPASPGTLKYLAEVLNVTADFDTAVTSPAGSQTDPLTSKSARNLIQKNKWSSSPAVSRAANLYQDSARMQVARAEPVFEEIGEAATRVRRSVSSWFNKTWGSLKDFFTNIFQPSERSQVDRERAFKESGVDIGQCKAPGGGKHGVGLPIDDSVFDDLEPKYYVGASFSPDSPPSAFEFGSGSDLDNDAGDDQQVSFFDDPAVASGGRSRRDTGKSAKASWPLGRSDQSGGDHERLLRLPFVFVQSLNGRVLEIRFGSQETDLSVKNFKRHLCDMFATNLDGGNKSQTQEVTPIGQHTTKYLLDHSLDSNEIRELLLSNKRESEQAKQQFVKALAVVVGKQQMALGDESDHDGDGKSLGEQRAKGDPGELSLSVLRSINATNQLHSPGGQVVMSAGPAATVGDIDRIQVSVKQVQQISDGRMVGSAGQLTMSLLSPTSSTMQPKIATRHKRSGGGGSSSTDTTDESQQQQQADIADLLQVSTSYTVQLVPATKLGQFDSPPMSHRDTAKRAPLSSTSASVDADNNDKKLSRVARSSPPASSSEKRSTSADTGNNTIGATKPDDGRPGAKKREPIIVQAPENKQQLERTLDEWRQLEFRLELKSANLSSESGGRFAGQLERLDVLRDQIQMRLNEEFMRNRLRQARGPQPVMGGGSNEDGKQTQAASNLMGLSLTQLILDTGASSRRKGSVYLGLEEALELEWDLAEQQADQQGGSSPSSSSTVTRLLRDTIRLDKLRSHCKLAIANLSDLRAQSSRLELKNPFNIIEDGDDLSLAATHARLVENNLTNGPMAQGKRKFAQCKQVLRLLLRAGERSAPDLVVDLMDTCNSRLLAASKDEELGHGPASRYYRNLRLQLTELLSQVRRPSESLLERLLTRLNYKPPPAASTGSRSTGTSSTAAPPEFTYVVSSSSAPNSSPSYNQSQLVEEDDLNNNDGAGSLVMTIATLAARPSIKRSKRVQMVEKLLAPLKTSRCSLLNGPDLDILESMANFRDPMDELVSRVVHLARRCKHQDQYLVACVHGLQGQLGHKTVQRFLIEHLLSTNSSCLLKSEIVLTLIGAVQQQHQLQQLGTSSSIGWPATSSNQVDEALMELVGYPLPPLTTSKSSGKRQTTPDQKCLSHLVGYYMELKRLNTTKKPNSSTSSKAGKADSIPSQRGARAHGRRTRRAVPNEDNFWDEAQCKRWSVGDQQPNGAAAMPTLQDELLLMDELDDNSIMTAIAAKRGQRGKMAALVERESDSGRAANGSIGSTTLAELQPPVVRRRHKCTASKTFGPKNAEATLKAEIVNDLVGPRDENKFLARFRLAANFLGQRIDVGRMYLWHQKRTTRAHVNIMGKSLWDTSHACQDQAPRHLQYMPLFDFNLWLVKISVGLRLNSQMGFFSNCQTRDLPAQLQAAAPPSLRSSPASQQSGITAVASDQLELYPNIAVQASAEASAKFVVARAGLSLAGAYGYQGNIRVSKQPESCMSVQSGHQPMNLTFASWFQLWDSDCHYWGSRLRGEPQATKWRLNARKSSVWLEDECLNGSAITMLDNNTTSSGNMTRQTISP